MVGWMKKDGGRKDGNGWGHAMMSIEARVWSGKSFPPPQTFRQSRPPQVVASEPRMWVGTQRPTGDVSPRQGLGGQRKVQVSKWQDVFFKEFRGAEGLRLHHADVGHPPGRNRLQADGRLVLARQ